jgi:flagellar protein FlbD
MIPLHRLAISAQPFHLNPDLIATVEACPDTTLGLTTGAKVVVSESPDEVVEAVRAWRAGLVAHAEILRSAG